MEIFLVRHGIAEAPERVENDSERRLTKEGHEKTERVAKAFARRVARVDLILHSPYARAAETAEYFAKLFPKAKKSSANGLTPHDSPYGALALLRDLADENVMFVGHEPHLSSLASLILTGQELPLLELKKAGIVGLECLPRLQHCRLSFLLSPKWL